jgi:hypothetical protein
MHNVEGGFVSAWFGGCLVGGLVFAGIGARAASGSLWGSLVGAFFGTWIVSSSFDALPYGAMAGASVGGFIGGLAGLTRRPRSDVLPRTLRGFGLTVLVIGALSTWALSRQVCPAVRFPKHCIYELSPRWLGLFALDAVWVAALCFIQAAQSNRVTRSNAPDDGGGGRRRPIALERWLGTPTSRPM